MIGHTFWQERFGANPSVIGQTVRLNNRPFTLIGVAPPDFAGTKAFLEMDFWVPLQAWRGTEGDWRENRVHRWLQLIGRLRPDASMETARAELEIISQRMSERHREEARRILQLESARGLMLDADPGITKTARLAGGMALAAVALVLFIACSNIANLMLARASARRQEISVRLALGASRWRVVRQLLTESLLLAFLGGAAGLVVSFWAARSMTVLMPIIPYKIAFDASPNFRVLLFAFALSTLTGLVFGLVPALRSVRSGLVTSLRAHAGGGAHRALLGRFLVTSQVAFAVVLLVITGLFVRSLNNITALETGFDRERLAFLTVDLSLAGLDRDAGRLLYQDLEQRLSSLAGVKRPQFSWTLIRGEFQCPRGWGKWFDRGACR